jgi:isopentenyldiphosphate isomerase
MPTENTVVVDDQDNVIGAKPRDEVMYGDIYRVSSLWLTNSHGGVLVAQRSWEKSKNPGKWGPAVAGTVEESETYEQNIYKEAEEEIGLTGIKFSLGPKVFVDEGGLRRFFNQWFLGQIDWPINKFTVRKSEVEAIAWIASNRLRAELKRNDEKYIAGCSKWEDLFL